ncbi:polysaccharide deacetylase family protein [Bifidobacterium sp. ESL0704]|uniref:polysaccharide deacetylase family protein n=1 Tax=Bifidobacterium sp. ESL0704 TaxID=2983219 RepID=UPI0023F6BC7C|nr:polysaccharide deacetylase family protein [Bifidobacterium sp. ESL0704]WEV52722.1 polysaccharide deacetylase family protein [Bifidobacterium sp. ESL0704]
MRRKDKGKESVSGKAAVAHGGKGGPARDASNDVDSEKENIAGTEGFAGSGDAGYSPERGQGTAPVIPVGGFLAETLADSEKESSEEQEPAIEELSIKTAKARKIPKQVRISLIVVVVLVIVLALTGVSAWGYGNFRKITVSVNGSAQQVSANTTLGKLAAKNDNFGAKPGDLLSVSGKVLKAAAGASVVYTLNGKQIKAADSTNNSSDNKKKGFKSQATADVPVALDSIKLPENAKITVKDGKNLTEQHDVRRTMVPFGVSVNGHGVIQKLVQRGKQGVKEVWIGKISGEQVDKGVVKEPKNVIVDTFSPKPVTHKVVALTFDDGPSQYSGPILDILKEKGIKATFFDVGNGAAAWPQFEQRMVAEGHQVASHSYSHPDMFKLNPDQLRDNITQGLANIKAASGMTTKMLRAPYGNFGPNQWLQTSDLIDYNVIWTVDTEDWKKPGAPAIANAALSKAYNGAVILMHDGGGDRSEDIAALPGIIDGLKGQGYEFVTIDQLMAMNGK